jgi:hypothetical protein
MSKTDIFGFLIKETRPLVGEIHDLLYGEKSVDKIAFIDFPQFQWEADLEQSDYDLINSGVEKFGEYSVAWRADVIRKYLPKMSWQKNIVLFFPIFGSGDSLLLKSKSWETAYHCVDRYIVELYTNSHEKADIIKNVYQVERIDYPGAIPGPGGFDVET